MEGSAVKGGSEGQEDENLSIGESSSSKMSLLLS